MLQQQHQHNQHAVFCCREIITTQKCHYEKEERVIKWLKLSEQIEADSPQAIYADGGHPGAWAFCQPAGQEEPCLGGWAQVNQNCVTLAAEPVRRRHPIQKVELRA
eukprot:scaffold195714_cov17-Prasinocladus_malaysianus.AAC.1